MAAAKTPGRRRKASVPRAAPSPTLAAAATGAHFALIGGQAVAARTEPRFTEDVDLAVSVADDEQAQQIVFGLTQRAGE